MYNFEKLTAWQKSMELIEVTYGLINKLPSEERFALIDQIKRSVTSVTLNIAEGSGAKSTKDSANFCRIALKSLYETVAGLKIAERIYKIDTTAGLQKCNEVGKLINGFLKYLESKN